MMKSYGSRRLERWTRNFACLSSYPKRLLVFYVFGRISWISCILVNFNVTDKERFCIILFYWHWSLNANLQLISEIKPFRSLVQHWAAFELFIVIFLWYFRSEGSTNSPNDSFICWYSIYLFYCWWNNFWWTQLTY